MEFPELIWAPYKVPGRIPSRIRIIALPIDTIFQCLSVQLAG
jgi:hypothetical protein